MATKRTHDTEKNEKKNMTTYHVTRKGGRDQRVTVPSHWRVTFGPLNPGSKNMGDGGNGRPALRFYESEKQQRMVITDVESFRDASIKVEEKRVNIKQQTMQRRTDRGAKDVVVEARVEEWVNPDAPDETKASEFYRLEKLDDGESF